MKHLLPQFAFYCSSGVSSNRSAVNIYLWEYEIDECQKKNILEFPEPNIIVDIMKNSYRHIFQSRYEIQIEPESIPFWFENDQIFF